VTLSNVLPVLLELEPDLPRAFQSLTALGMGLSDNGGGANVLEGVTLAAVSHKQGYDEWRRVEDDRRRVARTCASARGTATVDAVRACCLRPGHLSPASCIRILFPASKGDAGGPLFDRERRLIGVVFFGTSDRA
jgi:hypothetical protein